MAIKTCDTPDSEPFLVTVPVDCPWLSTVANKSSTNDNPEPFQKPIGKGRHDSMIAPGSVVKLPSLSYPPGNGNCSFFDLYRLSLPNEYWDMAISKTTWPSFRGTAITRGLFPNLGSIPPQGGILAMVLVKLMAIMPASAACQP